ncbi:regulatory protein [Haloactinospora alba]|uniref:Regulatory protein RecX n=1 Tax=Haloactinospora alba TaxID=405555 RepID=A0A543NGU0_9ACTN|nr:regulatory protein RecX [Haloactinospora alba]TQN31033.1 regulatory protein [Haloactinospora alba]
MSDGRPTQDTSVPEARAHESESPEGRARALCLRLLATAPRTRAQLERALRRHGTDESVIDTVLERFDAAGVVDDAAFADAWVESRHTGRGLGRAALTAELRERGVDEETIQQAVEDLDPDQEEATARELVRRKLRSTRGKAVSVRLRRTMGMLERKGYPAGLSYRLAREELEAEGADVDLPEPDTTAFE